MRSRIMKINIKILSGTIFFCATCFVSLALWVVVAENQNDKEVSVQQREIKNTNIPPKKPVPLSTIFSSNLTSYNVFKHVKNAKKFKNRCNVEEKFKPIPSSDRKCSISITIDDIIDSNNNSMDCNQVSYIPLDKSKVLFKIPASVKDNIEQYNDKNLVSDEDSINNFDRESNDIGGNDIPLTSNSSQASAEICNVREDSIGINSSKQNDLNSVSTKIRTLKKRNIPIHHNLLPTNVILEKKVINKEKLNDEIRKTSDTSNTVETADIGVLDEVVNLQENAREGQLGTYSIESPVLMIVDTVQENIEINRERNLSEQMEVTPIIGPLRLVDDANAKENETDEKEDVDLQIVPGATLSTVQIRDENNLDVTENPVCDGKFDKHLTTRSIEVENKQNFALKDNVSEVNGVIQSDTSPTATLVGKDDSHEDSDEGIVNMTDESIDIDQINRENINEPAKEELEKWKLPEKETSNSGANHYINTPRITITQDQPIINNSIDDIDSEDDNTIQKEPFNTDHSELEDVSNAIIPEYTLNIPKIINVIGSGPVNISSSTDLRRSVIQQVATDELLATYIQKLYFNEIYLEEPQFSHPYEAYTHQETQREEEFIFTGNTLYNQPNGHIYNKQENPARPQNTTNDAQTPTISLINCPKSARKSLKDVVKPVLAEDHDEKRIENQKATTKSSSQSAVDSCLNNNDSTLIDRIATAKDSDSVKKSDEGYLSASPSQTNCSIENSFSSIDLPKKAAVDDGSRKEACNSIVGEEKNIFILTSRDISNDDSGQCQSTSSDDHIEGSEISSEKHIQTPSSFGEESHNNFEIKIEESKVDEVESSDCPKKMNLNNLSQLENPISSVQVSDISSNEHEVKFKTNFSEYNHEKHEHGLNDLNAYKTEKGRRLSMCDGDIKNICYSTLKGFKIKSKRNIKRTNSAEG